MKAAQTLNILIINLNGASFNPNDKEFVCSPSMELRMGDNLEKA